MCPSWVAPRVVRNATAGWKVRVFVKGHLPCLALGSQVEAGRLEDSPKLAALQRLLGGIAALAPVRPRALGMGMGLATTRRKRL